MTTRRNIILSCEHADNRVPGRLKHLFASDPQVLQTHRAYDIGIASVARRLQKVLDCPLCVYEWTRLLIDVNRSRRASQFSEFSKGLSVAEKRHLIDAFYQPYREQLSKMTAEQLKKRAVLHLSLHSFTPVLKGQNRDADIGILYDPSRTLETAYAKALQSRLRQKTSLRIRRNYPYAGNSDGVATWLRKKYKQAHYLGIELELNQAFLVTLTPRQRSNFVETLAETI